MSESRGIVREGRSALLQSRSLLQAHSVPPHRDVRELWPVDPYRNPPKKRVDRIGDTTTPPGVVVLCGAALRREHST